MSGKHEVFSLLFVTDKHNKRNQMRTKHGKIAIHEKTLLDNIDVEKLDHAEVLKKQ